MRQYRTLGLVWFDKVQNEGIYHQDWRIENDPQADAAFRLGLVRAEPGPALTAPAGIAWRRARAGATGARACALMSS